MKKVSISKIDEYVKTIKNEDSIIWNGIDIIIKKVISYEEYLELINKVVDSCFNGKGEYLPEMKDPVLRELIVSYYTNISLPENYEHKYEILYRSKLYDFVRDNINYDQYKNIIDSVCDKINNRAEANVQYIYGEINKVMNSLMSLTDSVNKAFGGIEEGDIKNILGAISNGKLSEDKIVKAYMKYKKNG